MLSVEKKLRRQVQPRVAQLAAIGTGTEAGAPPGSKVEIGSAPDGQLAEHEVDLQPQRFSQLKAFPMRTARGNRHVLQWNDTSDSTADSVHVAPFAEGSRIASQ